MRKLITTAALGAASLVALASVGAQTPPPPPADGEMHGPMHVSGMGGHRMGERGMMGGRAMMMQHADANGDGIVTRDEAVAPIDKHFDMLDANHDGQISRDEMRARALAHFDKVDANHDGRIDAAERDAAHKAMMDRMGGPGGRRWGGPDMAGDMPPPPPPPVKQ